MRLKRTWKSIARNTCDYNKSQDRYHGLKEFQVKRLINEGMKIVSNGDSFVYKYNIASTATYFIPKRWLVL